MFTELSIKLGQDEVLALFKVDKILENLQNSIAKNAEIICLETAEVVEIKRLAAIRGTLSGIRDAKNWYIKKGE